MALTVTRDSEKYNLGSRSAVTASIAFDASYDAAGGGEPLTPADLGLGRINFIICEPTSGYVFEYDAANERLQAFYADYDAVADGALIEVADTTNLATLTGVRVFALGE